jgi:triacylglycerol lipase
LGGPIGDSLDEFGIDAVRHADRWRARPPRSGALECVAVWGRGLWAGVVVWAGVLVLPAAAVASSAVVLVSGFNTATPFTTPAASCAALAGPTWGASTGAAASLRAVGEAVFTAPVASGRASPGQPCTGPGGAVPPAGDVIDSNGDVDSNGTALVGFLQFLAARYGVTSVSLVGHSDGGLWSRAAITQMRAADIGPVVQSLTTLGTPHTGSFGADLAELVVNGQCMSNDPTEKAVCQALLSVIRRLVADLGPVTIRELSSSFLAGWNPQQTIGCPVAVAAGTFVRVPVIGSLLPRYYNPSDGIVGQASALGQASMSLDGSVIPGPGIAHLISLGSFPVIHSSTLSFLGTDDTLTNDAAVGAAVAKAVQADVTGPACSAPLLGASRPRRHAVTVRVERRFSALGVADRRGRIARRHAGGVAFLLGGASISCRGRQLRSVPLLGSRTVRIAVVRCSGTARVHGRVLLLRPDPRKQALVLTRRGRRLSARVRGPALRHLRVSVRVRGSWKLLRGGVTKLPAGTRTISVRALGVDKSGERWLATAIVGS